jgi:hypothetical protein
VVAHSLSADIALQHAVDAPDAVATIHARLAPAIRVLSAADPKLTVMWTESLSVARATCI